MSVQIQRRRYDCSALPKGWKREEVHHLNCLINPGKVDVVYISPCGKRLRTKPALARMLGTAVDLSTFDFRTGKLNPALQRKRKTKPMLFDYSRGVRTDATLTPPTRQTAMLGGRVAVRGGGVVRGAEEGGDKPRQLFWSRRLRGMPPPRSPHLPPAPLPSLPPPLKGGPGVDPRAAIQTLSAALHQASPITGQPPLALQPLTPLTAPSARPDLHLRPDQPLLQEVEVQEGDICSQEAAVAVLRRRLQEAIASLAAR